MLGRAALVVSISLLCASAQAQNKAANDPSETEARQRFGRGVELYREGNFDAALAEFERAYQVAPNYKILYNLAQVQAERHQYIEAVRLLRRYLNEGGGEVPADRRQAVEADLERLKDRTAELKVETNVEGAELFVNDGSAGKLPNDQTVLVNVGSCRIRVVKEGYTTAERTITIAGGDRPHVVLELTRTAAAPIAASARDARATESDLAPFWISAGAVAVLGATTAVFGVMTTSANSSLDKELARFPAQPTGISDARSKLKTMAALTDAFGAASIVAAGFAVYFLIDPPQHTERRSQGVQARLLPGPGNVALVGSF